MKILLVSGRFEVPVVEGTQKSVMNLANELVENGHEVSWLTKSYEKSPPSLDENVELIGSEMTFQNVLRNREITKGFDIVNVHTSSTNMALYWKLVSVEKLMVTWPAYKRWSKKERLIQRLTDNTATTDTVGQKLHQNRGITPYGVDLETYKPSRTPGKSEKLKILFIGKPNSRRGFDHICRVLEKLDFDFEFNYAVAKTRGNIEDAERKLEQHSLREKTNVHYGFVEDLPVYINENDVFINLIERSNSITSPPILTLEAMACGRVTISSEIQEFTNLIENGQNGFLRSYNDYNGLVDLLGKLDENREMLSEIGKKARETVLEKHAKEVSAEKFEDAYKKRLEL